MYVVCCSNVRVKAAASIFLRSRLPSRLCAFLYLRHLLSQPSPAHITFPRPPPCRCRRDWQRCHPCCLQHCRCRRCKGISNYCSTILKRQSQNLFGLQIVCPLVRALQIMFLLCYQLCGCRCGCGPPRPPRGSRKNRSKFTNEASCRC